MLSFSLDRVSTFFNVLELIITLSTFNIVAVCFQAYASKFQFDWTKVPQVVDINQYCNKCQGFWEPNFTGLILIWKVFNKLSSYPVNYTYKRSSDLASKLWILWLIKFWLRIWLMCRWTANNLPSHLGHSIFFQKDYDVPTLKVRESLNTIMKQN
jgi:hypothetical protein